MRGVTLLCAAFIFVGCDLIAPFDPEDQPLRDGGGDVEDFDPLEISDLPDGGVEPDECVPDCEGQLCGPDNCGQGDCSPGCDTDHICAACPPETLCDEPFDCVAPDRGRWVLVTASQFSMGSPPSDAEADGDEAQRQVTLTHDFIILSNEYLQEHFMGVLEGRQEPIRSEETRNCDGTCPAHHLTWHQAARFCNSLSLTAGYERCYDCTQHTCQLDRGLESPYECRGFRLPTEAEWEYAARAGSRSPRYGALDEIGWHQDNSDGALHQIANLEPNDWGLYDMLGNVAEWCHDIYVEAPDGPTTDPWGAESGALRVVRGGSWDEEAGEARAAARRGMSPGQRGFVGVRPVRSVTFPVSSVD